MKARETINSGSSDNLSGSRENQIRCLPPTPILSAFVHCFPPKNKPGKRLSVPYNSGFSSFLKLILLLSLYRKKVDINKINFSDKKS